MPKNKIKYLKPRMEFNPGRQVYEPILPLRKVGKKIRISVNWKWVITLLLTLGLLLAIFLVFLRIMYN